MLQELLDREADYTTPDLYSLRLVNLELNWGLREDQSAELAHVVLKPVILTVVLKPSVASAH